MRATMMSVGALDLAVFRWVNHSWAHPWLDAVMPFLSGNPLFMPALGILAVAMGWKGGVRGRLCVVMLVLVVGCLNNAVVGELKEMIGRPRPFLEVSDVRLLVGAGKTWSLPSSHAANWFAGLAVSWVYYRRSAWFMVPLAFLVSLSRVYNGVHYPSDVMAGGLVGLILGAGGVGMLNWLWRSAGRRWFPLWWRRLPSLVCPVVHADPLVPQPGVEPVRDPARAAARQWLRLGYVLVAVLFVARVVYLASDRIELSEDEAYQWLWSKHLALSYYSKPPLVAYAQFLGTRLWGDTELGVRFCAPLIAAGLGVLLLRFFEREVNARSGFWLVLMLNATPLMAAGSVLFTVDALSVGFWTLGMLSAWRALQAGGRTRDWAWLGFWLGCGCLSKYTALLQWVSILLLMGFWKTARRHWSRPGPYAALAINALCLAPVMWWNAQHGWVTVAHLEDRAGLTEAWRLTLRFLGDFTVSEIGLLNPVFFGGLLWAVVAVWRRRRDHALLMFFLAMGAPLFLGYWLYSLRARVHPNWIVPAVIPLFCLLVVYGDLRWRAGVRGVKRWLTLGLALGLPLVVVLHDTNLVDKLTGHYLPASLDPLRRVRGWSETGRVVESTRQQLAQEGKPVFVIGKHYGITGLLSFYLPGSRERAGRDPVVYFRSSDHPVNQFYFWRGYRDRVGQSAVYVAEAKAGLEAPASLIAEFESVTSLGVREIRYRGRVMHRFELFACRGLRPGLTSPSQR